MKQIDKNVYKEARYGRKHLMMFSIVALLLSLGALAGGIVMIVLGATSGDTTKIIWMCVVGGVLALLGLVFTMFSIVMFFTSVSMIKVENGSVKDGNRAIGTVNVLKCDKCGEELDDNSTFCVKCGTKVEGGKMCECGTLNNQDAQYCKSCGKQL